MLQLNKHSYDLNRPLVMGILNVTPDSLSDGGQYLDFDEALNRAEKMIEEGADIILAWALESGQDAGVWGGLSEDERRALKRRAARNRARMLESQNQF